MSRSIIVPIMAIASFIFTVPCYSQQEEKLTPKEFAIPTSPLFDLMGAAPSQVACTAAIKRF